VLHSSEFRNGAPLGGESVLVVGFGNSGGEIAIDLVEHGARPALAVRSPVNVMPRDVLGIPLVSLTIRLNRLPTRVLDAVAAPFGRLVRGDLTPYGLRSRDYGPATQIARDARIPLIDVGTIRLIRERRIRVHPGIERFTERGVVFTDGTEAEFSAVILATGYRPDFGFLEGGARWAADPRAIPRRGRAAEPGLHFTGFYVANTGTLREIGMEAQGIAYWVNKEKGRAKGVREA
jgi:cation diffusion facilitator CzcD-associated flavoprotein CzcO